MTRLCDAFEETFWPRFKWPEFADMPNKEGVVIILPVVGFADWGLGLPLDVEESLSMPVLAEASQRLNGSLPHLVLPPSRFIARASKESFFTMDVDDVHDSILEVVSSVKESGFCKVVFYNSSPLNEDVLDAAGRDLRIELGMQMFCINLAGIGLDLLEGRSSSRENCRILALDSSCFEAEAILKNAAEKLVGLLTEVAGKEPLARRGEIPKKPGNEG